MPQIVIDVTDKQVKRFKKDFESMVDVKVTDPLKLMELLITADITNNSYAYVEYVTGEGGLVIEEILPGPARKKCCKTPKN